MIKIQNLTKKFIQNKEEFTALNQISVTIPDGEIFGIIGKSGAGKSTFLRCLNLLERPTEGEIQVDKTSLTSLSEKKLRETRRKIGMIFQHFNLLAHATVFDNVALPLRAAGKSADEIKMRVNELLNIIELTDKSNSYPDELSGGQKQRVAIARALANKPNVLLCDEATSALDTQTTKSILNLLKKINKEYNVTIVLITHQIEVVKYICHQVAVMDKGRFAEVTRKDDFFKNPQSAEGKSLVFNQDFSNESVEEAFL